MERGNRQPGVLDNFFYWYPVSRGTVQDSKAKLSRFWVVKLS